MKNVLLFLVFNVKLSSFKTSSSSFILAKGMAAGLFPSKWFWKRKGWYNLLLKITSKDFIIVQVDVDDIIFNATNECLCKKFSKLMQGEFEIGMKLKFILGLQI